MFHGQVDGLPPADAKLLVGKEGENIPRDINAVAFTKRRKAREQLMDGNFFVSIAFR